jgi:pimeloyl-ACP methyl ester carboxylesterase
MDGMNRRQALRSSVTAAGGLSMMAAGLACAATTDAPAMDAARAAPGRGRARTDPFVETHDGTRLFHLDWGTGKPVVFLHAWALNADLWEYQMTELVDRGLRCVAYDRRGHGRSSDPGRGYDFDTLADDLATLLEQLDLHDVTLVGHSMGGGEIARYLTRHGTARIARAVLTSAVTPIVARRPDYPEGTAPEAYEALVAALKADRPAAVTAGVPLFTGARREVSPAMVQWLTAQFLRASPKAAIECMRAIAVADFRPDMRSFTIPTLIIHGDDDQLNNLDRTGRKTAQAIRGSELRIYDGAPHGLPLTDRSRFTQDLLAFARG